MSILSNSGNSFKVDQARYMTFEDVVKSIDPEVKKWIKPVSSIVATSSADTHESYKLVENVVFMGCCTHVGKPTNNPTVVQLSLEEISLEGVNGPKFFVTLHSVFSKEWENNPTLKAAFAVAGGKLIVTFKNVFYQMTATGVHFHLRLNKNINGSWINFKNYFPTKSLTDAAEKKKGEEFHLFAVVQRILKAPTKTKNGRYHGMFSLVDPSCYENMAKLRDYRFDVFENSLNNFPEVAVGDVIRVYRVETEHFGNKVNFVCNGTGRDVVVFPFVEKETPCSATCFALGKEEITKVEGLKKWSLGQNKQHAPITTIDSKLITLNEINAETDTFDLTCRLVEYFDEKEGAAMWVEDGTKCPLYTCSDVEIQPFNSQATQDLSNNCPRIRIHCSKKLLARLELNEEKGKLLCLRRVKMTLQTQHEHGIDVAQFEVLGSVELLPLNTKHYKLLLQRPEKSMPETTDLEPSEFEMDFQNGNQMEPSKCSTCEGMDEFPSDIFLQNPQFQTSVSECEEFEPMRFEVDDYIGSQVLMCPAMQSPLLATLDGLSFSQAISSTPNPAQNESIESNEDTLRM